MTTRFITPSIGPLDAVVRVPGSKSVANRALVCAMLANGDSIVSGLPDGDDTAVIISVLSELGRCHQLNESAYVVSGNPVASLPGIVDARLAGTSSRFLTAVAALSESTTVIDGAEPLRARPMHGLHDALESLGVNIAPLGEPGHLPVSVSRGDCVGGHVSIRGDVSSQFISALMLIAPTLPQGLTILVEGDLVSRSYVEMTAHVMRSFGADVDISNHRIEVRAGGYVARDYTVEPDYSSAAFPIAALLMRGGRVRVCDLATSHMQGDAEMARIAEEMGAKVVVDGSDVVFERDAESPLLPLIKNMEDCSDLVPAVATVCAIASGVSTITGVGFIRKKESDRLGDLANELSKSGAHVQVDDDGLSIQGVKTLTPASFETHHDHRLAMALALVSLAAGTAEIQDPQVVSKSWPRYFEDMASILG